MSHIESQLQRLGLELPAPILLPPNVKLSFPWVRISGSRAYISGHGPLNSDGSIAGPLGKVGKGLSLEEGYHAARLTALAMLASLKVALGDLDRVDSWLRVFGMVNTDPSFNSYPLVINGFSDLIAEVYGGERGSHARSAIGVAGLPFDLPVEIEAEVLIRP
jgi:enamine deaminase RidA (YjgF/YER057c/UK114 family)